MKIYCLYIADFITGPSTMEPLNNATDPFTVVPALARLCRRFRLTDTVICDDRPSPASLETTPSGRELGWQSQWVQGTSSGLMQRHAAGF